MACQSELPTLPYACWRCAHSLPQNTRELICGQCLRNKPPFDRTYALLTYEPPVTKLILAIKFSHNLANARLLGELLALKIKKEWYSKTSLPTAIIPVPLHPSRLKERGFNQAIEIARPITRELHIPMLVNGYKRIKPTLPQATLPADQRKKNISGAFYGSENIKNQHIAVIDDVITTGHTMNEFCNLLKKQGARQIDVWCCARPALSEQPIEKTMKK